MLLRAARISFIRTACPRPLVPGRQSGAFSPLSLVRHRVSQPGAEASPKPREGAKAVKAARGAKVKKAVSPASLPKPHRSDPSPAAASSYASSTPDAPDLDTPNSSPTQTLRPYQTEAIDACLSALARGRRRIGVSSPTGSGKTTMFMNLIPRIPPVDALDRVAPHVLTSTSGRGSGVEVEDGGGASADAGGGPGSALGDGGGPGEGQTLVLVGSVELAEQARLAATRILGEGWSVEIEQAKRVASGFADVTVATYQTLSNDVRLRKFNPARFKLVIVDEAHHAAARSYLRLLHYFNRGVALPPDLEPYDTLEDDADVPIVGFSATFSRHDTLALSAVFEEIVFHRDVGYMLEEGWLSPVKSTAVYADLQLNDVERTQSGEYATSSLAAHVNTPAVNMLIVRTYLHRAHDRRSTLVFAVNLQHVSDLVAAFRRAGIDARPVTSSMSAAARRDTMAAFRANEFPVLVNCEVLTEGADVPEIDCVILARPTRSKNLLAQMVGRGLRLSPDTGKEDCYLIDIADNISRASGMLVAPTLFGLSHEEVAEERARMDASMSRRSDFSAQTRPEPIAAPSKIKMVDSSDPFGLSSSSPPTSHIPALSPLAWVHCGKGRFILELMGAGHVTIEPVERQWSVSFTPKLPLWDADGRAKRGSPYARVQQLAYADNAERAVRTADAFVERRSKREIFTALHKRAAWRARPATPKQLGMLLKLKGIRPEPAGGDNAKQTIMVAGRPVNTDTLTAGQVAALLCAAQHGGLGARQRAEKRAEAAQARAARVAEKERVAAERNLPIPGS